MTIFNNDLIIATQGRAFYIVDNLNLIQQYEESIVSKKIHLFAPEKSYRTEDFKYINIKNEGENLHNGVVVHYFIKDIDDSSLVKLKFIDSRNKVIQLLSTKADKKNKLTAVKGFNETVWDMKHSDTEPIEGMILWNGKSTDIKIAPGIYTVRLIVNKDSVDGKCEIVGDPNYKMSQEDYISQEQFLLKVKDKFTQVQNIIKDIRDVKSQMNSYKNILGKDYPKDLENLQKEIDKNSGTIEGNLYQNKAKAFQDLINYPIKLNDKLAGVFNEANSAYSIPSRQVIEVYEELSNACNIQITEWKKEKDEKIVQYNKIAQDKLLPVIIPIK